MNTHTVSDNELLLAICDVTSFSFRLNDIEGRLLKRLAVASMREGSLVFLNTDMRLQTKIKFYRATGIYPFGWRLRHWQKRLVHPLGAVGKAFAGQLRAEQEQT